MLFLERLLDALLDALQIPPEMVSLTGETVSAAGMVYDTPSSMAENCGFIQIPQSGCFFEIFVL